MDEGRRIPPTATPVEQQLGACRLWNALREAISGTEQDFTEGSIGRAIVLLSIPMVLEMAMESLFGIVNIFWVSRLGADAIATVGLTEALLTIVFAIAMGLSLATTATVARRIGEKDPEGASVAAVQTIALGIFVSIPIGLVGLFFVKELFQLMKAEPSVIAAGTGYGRIIFGANVVVMLLFLINAIFRGAGDAAIAMRALWFGNLINLVLDPCFIFGLGPFPEWGVTGSAVATTIGRGLAVVYQLSVLLRRNSRVPVRFNHLWLDFGVMRRLVRISVGGMFQYLVATASWVGLVWIVDHFGKEALAGYTVALRIIVVTILPSWGMSNAAATLVGQNLGAGKPERAERSVWVTGFSNMVFLAGVAIVFILFAEWLIHLFTRDPAVVPYGVDCLRYISYGYIFYAYGMVMLQSFNGAGDTYTPTVINLFCYWLFQIPLAYVLAMKLDFGAQGVFLAITIAESMIAVVAVIAFRRGRWKEQQV